MKSDKFRPYVRRANGRERPNSLRVAMLLEFYRRKKRPFYVMVQRGFPNLVIECGATRRDLEQSVLPVFAGMMTFRRWSRQMMERAAGMKRKGGS